MIDFDKMHSRRITLETELRAIKSRSRKPNGTLSAGNDGSNLFHYAKELTGIYLVLSNGKHPYNGYNNIPHYSREYLMQVTEKTYTRPPYTHEELTILRAAYDLKHQPMLLSEAHNLLHAHAKSNAEGLADGLNTSA